MDGLVRQGEHVGYGIQMPDRGVNIGGFHRIPAPNMHRIERLAEADEIAIIQVITGTATPLPIRRIGGGGHGAERQRIVANVHVAGRVAGMKRERLRGLADLRGNQGGIKPHALRTGANIGPGLFQNSPRFRQQKIHANLGQDLARRLMDGLQLIVRNSLDRCERRTRLRLGMGLRGLRCLTRRRAPATAPMQTRFTGSAIIHLISPAWVNRRMIHERNSPTAALSRSSRCIVR